MARGDQLGRQWRILQILIGSRSGKTVSELAAEIECHPRTVYRDLEALQIAGFPLFTDRSEGKTHWALLDSARQNAPLPLTLTELMALYFSRKMMHGYRDTIFSESLESLFEKIRATFLGKPRWRTRPATKAGRLSNRCTFNRFGLTLLPKKSSSPVSHRTSVRRPCRSR